MKIKRFTSRTIFLILNYMLLSAAALFCILPIINVLSVSLSAPSFADAGLVGLWPLGFRMNAYSYVLTQPEFLRAALISIERVLLGYAVNMLLLLITAYPLSKKDHQLKFRNAYCWFLVITMLFNGGLVPTYILVTSLKLTDSLLALVLPGAVQVFNVILLINFFRNIPDDYSDAANIDGAGHWTILWRVYVPLSTPVLATLSLFVVVGHWNSWFDGIIYMNRASNYPLQSYLQTVVINIASAINMDLDKVKDFLAVSDKTVKSARIFIAAMPVMLLYIPLQKYFIKGITLGGIKG